MENLSFNPKSTIAILIGSSEYEQDFSPIPNIRNNILDLKTTLAKDSLLGIPSQNIIEILDKTHDKTIELISQSISNPHFDTLIFYYSGHGYPTLEGQLFLTTTNSKKATIKYTSLPFEDIRVLFEESHLQNKIIIIDCCYSGLAAMSDTQTVVEFGQEVNGTYILTSSPHNSKSYFDEDVRNTFFTSELISLINSGIDSKLAFLSLDDAYQSIQRAMKKKKLPEPRKKNTLNVADFYFCRNKNYYPSTLLLGESETKRKFDAILVEGKYDVKDLAVIENLEDNYGKISEWLDKQCSEDVRTTVVGLEDVYKMANRILLFGIGISIVLVTFNNILSLRVLNLVVGVLVILLCAFIYFTYGLVAFLISMQDHKVRIQRPDVQIRILESVFELQPDETNPIRNPIQQGELYEECLYIFRPINVTENKYWWVIFFSKYFENGITKPYQVEMKWGLRRYNSDNNVTGFYFDYIEKVDENTYAVRYGNRWYFMDEKGRFIN